MKAQSEQADRTCWVCGRPFVVPRRAGRPAETDSDECKAFAKRYGEFVKIVSAVADRGFEPSTDPTEVPLAQARLYRSLAQLANAVKPYRAEQLASRARRARDKAGE